MSRETARYSFTESSSNSIGSAIVYDDDSSITIHSDSCPARGTHGAFDLVRLHKFGHLDKDSGDLPIAERPSQKAMIEFANDLPEIRAMRAATELEDLGELPEAAVNDDASWLDTPATPAAKSPFRVIPAAEFAGGDSTEPEWQIEELVPKVGVGISYGQSRAFKSFAILDKAACIHRGTPWHKRPVRKGRAVLIVAEGAFGFKNRMRAYAKYHGVSLDELPAVIPAAPQLFLADQNKLKPLIDELKAYGATYVAIDNQTQCMPGGDESSTKDMILVQRSYATISERVGCFVDAISHTGHGDQSHARGSSTQRPAVDVEVFHERDGNEMTATLEVRKLKEGVDGAVFTIKMQLVPLGIYAKSRKPYGSLALEHVETERERVRLTKIQKQAKAVLVKLSPNGQRVATDDVEARIIEVKGIKAVKGYHHRDARKTLIELRDLGVIRIDGEFCSLSNLIQTEDWPA